MSFIDNIKFKTVFILAFMVSIGLSGSMFAQEADSAAQAVDTTATVGDTDTAVTADMDTAAAATGTDTTDTAASAGSVGATPTATSDAAGKPGINPQVYTNFFYYVLLFFLLCILVAVIGKILQVYELTRKMNGKDSTHYLNNIQAGLFIVALVTGLYGVYWSYVHHGAQSMREAATQHGVNLDIMFMVTTVICTIVLVLTHIALFGFAFRYRARENRKAYFYPHNNTIEKVWTIVPAIVLTILVLFGFFNWRAITNIPEEEQKNAIQIEVIGEQFMWTVRYAGRDGAIGERNYKLTTPLNGLGIDFNDKKSWDDQMGSEIVIPVNKPVRFQITSKDILHSFYIPDFRVQINAVPGMKTYFQFTPTITTEEMRDKLDDYSYNYVMLCAKICGANHFNMQKLVRVVTEEEYKEWLNEQPYFFTEDLRKEFQVTQVNEDTADAKLLAATN
ncbi:cytochrome c oxidase subunit II [Parapedobacter tibetensis]|uniref:cytochrome c oxidase subunit II n=1 Tax=Parapedobacter tibetensis TaxID=2972951 RepID=UPI00214D72E6|nr:cytochrome c oxidase subunit II [Parapedobacter tibetensis]